MISKEYGCSLAFLVGLAISPLPVGAIYAIGESDWVKEKARLTKTEKTGLYLLDAAKWALLLWGTIDLLFNGGANVLNIAVPYLFCSISSLIPPVIATNNNAL